MDYSIDNNTLILLVSKTLYTESVIYKCFYWYTGQNRVQIIDDGKNSWCIKLQLTPDQTMESNLQALQDKISRDLIDFRLRDIVTRETTVVRELLIAKAFSHYETEDTPTTSVSDPVGFNPDQIINPTHADS